MAVEEALDFSLKKLNRDKSPGNSTASADSSRSPTSTASLVSPQFSTPTADLFRRAMMDPVAAIAVPGSPTAMFSSLPTPPCVSLLTPDPSLLPTTSLALSALHRRRRKISTSSELNDCSLKKPKPVPDEHKDNAYWERRRKNNEAAKRSRDTRKAKEDEIALRAAYLEQENLKLKAQVNVLKNEMARLHCLLFSQIQS